METIVEELGESEALRLIEQAEVGRIGFTGRHGPVVLPVSYKVIGQDIVFRAGMYSTLGEDLRTGIPGAEYRVAFEVDELRPPTQSGWMVMIQGTAHHVDDEAGRAELIQAGVEKWEATENALFMRITPVFVSGRRISRGLPSTAAHIVRPGGATACPGNWLTSANGADDPGLGVPGYCVMARSQPARPRAGMPQRDKCRNGIEVEPCVSAVTSR
jgi:nitroimidazol reductase NimA-like FMN-containing flavoprotein (pyridoxamine 5'-phosphate oxidase superfamily)